MAFSQETGGSSRLLDKDVDKLKLAHDLIQETIYSVKGKKEGSSCVLDKYMVKLTLALDLLEEPIDFLEGKKGGSSRALDQEWDKFKLAHYLIRLTIYSVKGEKEGSSCVLDKDMVKLTLALDLLEEPIDYLEGKKEGSLHVLDESFRVLSLKKRLVSLSAEGKNAIFWDFENCPVPKNKFVEDVVRQIKMALNNIPLGKGKVGQISTFSAYKVSFPNQLRLSLESEGVKTVDVPYNGRGNDAADLAMIVDMFDFAFKNSPPTWIVLISGDADFAPTLHELSRLGYQIVVVIPDDIGRLVKHALVNAATLVWSWSDITKSKDSQPYVYEQSKDENREDESLLLPMLPLNQMLRPDLIAVFWDISHCKLPNWASRIKLSENVRKSLWIENLLDGVPIRSFGGYMDFRGVYDDEIDDFIEALSSTSISLVNVPCQSKNKMKKDGVEKKILLDLFRFAFGHAPPACIVLITSNNNFVHAVNVLRRNGYLVIVVSYSDQWPSFVEPSSGYFWKWNRVVSGKKGYI